MSGFFDRLLHAIECREVDEKCRLVMEIYQDGYSEHANHDGAIQIIDVPGFPERLKLVPPRELKRRGMATQEGRNRLLHAIAQIEFNAINLALDAAYRFRYQPESFYSDWLSVAADEARHFQMVRQYLLDNGCDYGDYPVHNGLWEMATKTQHDVLARMALVRSSCCSRSRVASIDVSTLVFVWQALRQPSTPNVHPAVFHGIMGTA